MHERTEGEERSRIGREGEEGGEIYGEASCKPKRILQCREYIA